MATFRGMDGSLQFNAQAVGEVKSWNIDTSMEVADTTKMGDTWKASVGLQGSFRGTAQCNLDYGDTNGQKVIIDRLLAATAAGLVGQFRASATKYISCNIIITGMTINAVLNDVIQVTFTFTGNGAPTISWA